MNGFLCASCGSHAPNKNQGRRDCAACAGPLLLDERYRLEHVIAHGAIGTTYLATELASNQQFAIKELSFARLDSFKTQELFAREARVLKQLAHPGIPACHDDFVWGIGKHQAFYLVEEYIEGVTLEVHLKRSRPSEREVLEMLLELARILAYLHSRTPRIIHRDIKPDNIMRREDGSLALIDFGAVRDDALLPSGKLTITGTPGYMAPEQVRGVTSAASDVWAMGALAVTMFTRESPSQFIEAEGTFAWRDAVENQVSQGGLALLEAMLQPSPGERIEDGAALAAHIEEVLEGKTSLVPSTTSHAASRDKRTRAPGTAPRTSTELMAPAPSYLATPRRQRGESLFGLYILAGAGVVGVMPCVVFFVGLSEAAMGMSTLLLLMIFMIPFIPAEEQTDPSRLLEE